MSTKAVNYIMFCVGIGVVISTPMPQIDISLYACDVGNNTLCETLSRCSVLNSTIQNQITVQHRTLYSYLVLYGAVEYRII